MEFKTVTKILHDEFNSIRVDLIKRHNELGMKASGKWEKGLEVNATKHKSTLLGEHYTYQLVNGRKNGKFPPRENIEQWIRDKGIQSELKVSILAFLIARKIAKEGTKYFRQGGTDLIDSVITPERIQSILDKISHVSVTDFTHMARQTFKQLKLTA